MSSHYKIRTEKTGHYFTRGSLTGKTKFVWICLHGYGQLAKYFISKFEFLDPELHFVIVPEGLNRFYFEGVSERPVASWMTREDRLDEIADYVQFLESLRAKVGWDKNPDVKIIYLGFSQGVNTLMRWLMNVHQRCDHLVFWAGAIPDDVLYTNHQAYLSSIPVHYFIGKDDPYFKEQQINEIQKLIDRAGLKVTLKKFEGDHKVDENVLRRWIEQELTSN